MGDGRGWVGGWVGGGGGAGKRLVCIECLQGRKGCVCVGSAEEERGFGRSLGREEGKRKTILCLVSVCIPWPPDKTSLRPFASRTRLSFPADTHSTLILSLFLSLSLSLPFFPPPTPSLPLLVCFEMYTLHPTSPHSFVLPFFLSLLSLFPPPRLVLHHPSPPPPLLVLCRPSPNALDALFPSPSRVFHIIRQKTTRKPEAAHLPPVTRSVPSGLPFSPPHPTHTPSLPQTNPPFHSTKMHVHVIQPALQASLPQRRRDLGNTKYPPPPQLTPPRRTVRRVAAATFSLSLSISLSVSLHLPLRIHPYTPPPSSTKSLLPSTPRFLYPSSPHPTPLPTHTHAHHHAHTHAPGFHSTPHTLTTNNTC